MHSQNFINIMAIKCLPTRVTTNFALCGLVLLIISTCKAQPYSNDTKNRLVRRHMMVFQQFPCGPPQPRSISVQELLGDKLETSEIAQPHTTVLHRCDKGTGCCSQTSKVCKVAEIEEVDLHFFITDTIRNHKPEFREFQVKNHTKCSCQSIEDTIK